MRIGVEQLGKSFGGKAVLWDVSFQTEGFLCIMGSSGIGKTTLLRILLGLERPDSGRVIAPVKCRWAAVFQEDRLLEGRDAAGNLRFVLGGGYDAAGAGALLEELGLGGTGTKPVRTYSGGMRRRLALARALLAPSDALALDEPFAGLDGESRRRCIDAIRRRCAGKPVLLATHDSRDAEALGAEILTLGK